MRLDRLEISGFKSFSDRSELSFDQGVTAIVGPNGCGKSNVADAITWVLGEQSAKSLRGDKMEDVIFNGSDARKPGAAAEVACVLAAFPRHWLLRRQPATSTPVAEVPTLEEFHPAHQNGNGHDAANGNGHAVIAELADAFTRDVEVTRRLYRSGESEYLIDGAVCRLRDVHELLMDTGLGAKAYSIIEQGKIGMILSSRPADRRQLIEEAAGDHEVSLATTGGKLKLEAAQQNLTRIDDIVFEVEKQRGALKRQAAKARRYGRLREEFRRWEKVLFARRYRDLAGAIESARGAAGRRPRARDRGRGARVAEVEADSRAACASSWPKPKPRATTRARTAHARELDINRRQQQQSSSTASRSRRSTRATGEVARRDRSELEARREPARLGARARREPRRRPSRRSARRRRGVTPHASRVRGGAVPRDRRARSATSKRRAAKSVPRSNVGDDAAARDRARRQRSSERVGEQLGEARRRSRTTSGVERETARRRIGAAAADAPAPCAGGARSDRSTRAAARETRAGHARASSTNGASTRACASREQELAGARGAARVARGARRQPRRTSATPPAWCSCRPTGTSVSRARSPTISRSTPTYERAVEALSRRPAAARDRRAARSGGRGLVDSVREQDAGRCGFVVVEPRRPNGYHPHDARRAPGIVAGLGCRPRQRTLTPPRF